MYLLNTVVSVERVDESSLQCGFYIYTSERVPYRVRERPSQMWLLRHVGT